MSNLRSARSTASFDCNYCPKDLHRDMYRMAQDSISEGKDPSLTLERMLAQWPHMAGNSEHAWLNHLLGYDGFEIVHAEAQSSSAGEAKELHH